MPGHQLLLKTSPVKCKTNLSHYLKVHRPNQITLAVFSSQCRDLIQEIAPYAIKTQQKAGNSSSRGYFVPKLLVGGQSEQNIVDPRPMRVVNTEDWRLITRRC